MNDVGVADEVAMPAIANVIAFGSLLRFALPFNLLSHAKLLVFNFLNLLILLWHHCDKHLMALSEA